MRWAQTVFLGKIWVRLVFSNIKNNEFQFVFYGLCLDVMNGFCKLGNYDFE